jgi:hypothetical protein
MTGKGRYGGSNGFGKGRRHDVAVLGESNDRERLRRKVSCGDVATQAPEGFSRWGCSVGGLVLLKNSNRKVRGRRYECEIMGRGAHGVFSIFSLDRSVATWVKNV